MSARAALWTPKASRSALAVTLAIFVAAFSATGGFSQTQGQPAAVRAEPPSPPVPQPLETPPPYEKQLLRLSEILGALAWLTEVCGEGPGDEWRRQMASLIEAEATSPARRERLAGA